MWTKVTRSSMLWKTGVYNRIICVNTGICYHDYCSRWTYCAPAFLVTQRTFASTCANTRACWSVAGKLIVLQHSWPHREQYNHTGGCIHTGGRGVCPGVAGKGMLVALQHSWLQKQYKHLCEYLSLPRCSRWTYYTSAFLKDKHQTMDTIGPLSHCK